MNLGRLYLFWQIQVCELSALDSLFTILLLHDAVTQNVKEYNRTIEAGHRVKARPTFEKMQLYRVEHIGQRLQPRVHTFLGDRL